MCVEHCQIPFTQPCGYTVTMNLSLPDMQYHGSLKYKITTLFDFQALRRHSDQLKRRVSNYIFLSPLGDNLAVVAGICPPVVVGEV